MYWLLLNLLVANAVQPAVHITPSEHVEVYIEQHCSESVDPTAIAEMLVAAVDHAQASGCTDPPDPLLLACIARYESGFNPQASSGACRGLLQIHRIHRGSMADMGLDYDIEVDRLLYGCWLYSWHGLKPWSVRRLAQRDYQESTK